MTTPLVIADPKGRNQEELSPLLARVGIHPEKAFFNDSERQLQFACVDSDMQLIRVRSFDVATFVAFGAAQIGICGSDVLMEFDYGDIYAPLDLKIGKCRLCVAEPQDMPPQDNLERLSHLRVATKYPNVTRRYFAEQGIQAECIRLSGAMELAPKLGLAPRIVDLVSSGRTLKANGLQEAGTIAEVSSRLIVNRIAFKTRSAEINTLIERFREAVNAA
ncbi:MAG: ATP phosphoribosyltransferase [Pseudomonadota bacterium]|nr:ATP phosphoribosyltransferase [Pseudomonadota bacterium]